MYENVLVPIALEHDRDFKEALHIATAISAENAKITALFVMEEVPSYVSQFLPDEQRAEVNASMLRQLEQAVEDTPNVKAAVVTGQAGHTIVDYADEHNVDCIVVASHRPGLQDFFLGSTAARVVRHAKCAVHVSR